MAVQLYGCAATLFPQPDVCIKLIFSHQYILHFSNLFLSSVYFIFVTNMNSYMSYSKNNDEYDQKDIVSV